MTNPNGDLFGSTTTKAPSVAFKTIGTKHVMKITDWPSEKEGKDFETGQVERWPDGAAKKILLVPVTIDGVPHPLWVTRGKALIAAIVAAQQAAGAQIAPGGTLTVTFTHEVPSSKGEHFHNAKQYEASYSPPDLLATGNTFAKPAPAAPAPAPAAAPAAPAVNGNGKQGITAEAFAALAAVPGMDMTNFYVLVV